jgi:hypothetical protein
MHLILRTVEKITAVTFLARRIEPLEAAGKSDAVVLVFARKQVDQFWRTCLERTA